jgi:hypothetical protein
MNSYKGTIESILDNGKIRTIDESLAASVAGQARGHCPYLRILDSVGLRHRLPLSHEFRPRNISYSSSYLSRAYTNLANRFLVALRLI